MTDQRKPPSVMRSLGLTLGDLWSVLKSGKPRPPVQKQVRTETATEERQTEQGRVTLRRTIVEEIEISPPPADQDPCQGKDQPRT
jgi:hypothetical protein